MHKEGFNQGKTHTHATPPKNYHPLHVFTNCVFFLEYSPISDQVKYPVDDRCRITFLFILSCTNGDFNVFNKYFISDFTKLSCFFFFFLFLCFRLYTRSCIAAVVAFVDTVIKRSTGYYIRRIITR